VLEFSSFAVVVARGSCEFDLGERIQRRREAWSGRTGAARGAQAELQWMSGEQMRDGAAGGVWSDEMD
jgi:hypothetical protein